MLCPSCNKFATYDTSTDPEVEVDYSDEHVTGTVRIVLTSECCGDELKEFAFDIDEDFSEELSAAVRSELGLGESDDVDLSEWDVSVDADGEEVTANQERYRAKTLKNGAVKQVPIPSRYARTFYGFSLTLTVTAVLDAGNGQTFKVAVTRDVSDEVQASSMDELV